MVRPSGIITIITDFGHDDYFVGALKGAMLTQNPGARLVDVSHDVLPGDIRHGAYILANSYPEFPPGTVHYCVVDPGVGSSRKPLAIYSNEHYFVVPDNGIVYPGIAEFPYKAYEINPGYLSGADISRTFHGRDIFAPTSGLLSSGLDISELGEQVELITHYAFPEPEKIETGLKGEVLHIDRFGNIVTNFENGILKYFDSPVLMANDFKVELVFDYYHETPGNKPFIIRGSAGFLEISVRDSSAKMKLGVGVGAELLLTGE
ncbi:MAG: hypothetical protein GF307_14935 [candidate division Zixibacteria bacterium]|nr:hypothetical protein [candidate division Zixibacteria bacterium]